MKADSSCHACNRFSCHSVCFAYDFLMQAINHSVRGRLAPSPTGYLHLGNAWAFLLAWAACRSQNGTLVLRMEDIDPDRSREEFATAIVKDLHWLGLDWDEGPDLGGPCAPYSQSARLDLYRSSLEQLLHAGLAYPCYCTRKELRSLAGAPHVGDAGAAYPGTCRNLSREQQQAHEAAGRRACIRLLCPEHPYSFHDRLHGLITMKLNQCGGDFALQRSDGVIAYQLAVAVDDGHMRISQVVRGEDILVSTPRQLALFELLGLPRPQEYIHLPLLCDPEGERLAKRHSSLTLRSLREKGIRPEVITGYLAQKAGFLDTLVPLSPHEMLPLFSLTRLKAIQAPLCIEQDIVTTLRRYA